MAKVAKNFLLQFSFLKAGIKSVLKAERKKSNYTGHFPLETLPAFM